MGVGGCGWVCVGVWVGVWVGGCVGGWVCVGGGGGGGKATYLLIFLLLNLWPFVRQDIYILKVWLIDTRVFDTGPSPNLP